jgi:hypothetical protein
MNLNPQNLLWYDAVQIFALLGLYILFGWLAKRSIKQGEVLARLEILVTNHFSHRFDKLKERVGIEEWDDEVEGK